MEHDRCENDDDFDPGLDPILDNIERWPNILIMDSLLDSAGRFSDDTPPPDAIIRALDGLEKLALARRVRAPAAATLTPSTTETIDLPRHATQRGVTINAAHVADQETVAAALFLENPHRGKQP